MPLTLLHSRMCLSKSSRRTTDYIFREKFTFSLCSISGSCQLSFCSLSLFTQRAFSRSLLPFFDSILFMYCLVLRSTLCLAPILTFLFSLYQLSYFSLAIFILSALPHSCYLTRLSYALFHLLSFAQLTPSSSTFSVSRFPTSIIVYLSLFLQPSITLPPLTLSVAILVIVSLQRHPTRNFFSLQPRFLSSSVSPTPRDLPLFSANPQSHRRRRHRRRRHRRHCRRHHRRRRRRRQAPVSCGLVLRAGDAAR